LDASHIKTAKSEQDIIKKIEAEESYVCVATQMIFSHRYIQKFDLIGIPSVDSLVSIPDYRAEEGLFNQFEKLLDFEPEEIITQTYNPDSSFYSLLTSSNYKDFYDAEMPLRKLFWYPPFARLIKLSFRHSNKIKASYEARILGEKLKMAIVQRKMDKTVKLLGPSPAFIEKERGLYAYHIVLKILPEQRPDEVLRFVPSNWIIDVDPKSIL
jgi:primosomal protein N' (replication factor Y)